MRLKIGYKFAFKGGLSFNLGDVIIPQEKDTMVDDAYDLGRWYYC